MVTFECSACSVDVSAFLCVCFKQNRAYDIDFLVFVVVVYFGEVFFS